MPAILRSWSPPAEVAEASDSDIGGIIFFVSLHRYSFLRLQILESPPGPEAINIEDLPPLPPLVPDIDLFSEDSMQPKQAPVEPEFSWFDQCLASDLPSALVAPYSVPCSELDAMGASELSAAADAASFLIEGNEELYELNEQADTEGTEALGTGIESPLVLHDRLANLIKTSQGI
ncbi:hypothetical protein B0H10DRAFT_1939268 [Mycena sp. CBHHK59/15]|nr:hypothetical protein B0H10DRAFT_1939268 [Mycena sp. CBHHK59/15]